MRLFGEIDDWGGGQGFGCRYNFHILQNSNSNLKSVNDQKRAKKKGTHAAASSDDEEEKDAKKYGVTPGSCFRCCGVRG